MTYQLHIYAKKCKNFVIAFLILAFTAAHSADNSLRSNHMDAAQNRLAPLVISLSLSPESLQLLAREIIRFAQTTTPSKPLEGSEDANEPNPLSSLRKYLQNLISLKVENAENIITSILMTLFEKIEMADEVSSALEQIYDRFQYNFMQTLSLLLGVSDNTPQAGSTNANQTQAAAVAPIDQSSNTQTILSQPQQVPKNIIMTPFAVKVNMPDNLSQEEEAQFISSISSQIDARRLLIWTYHLDILTQSIRQISNAVGESMLEPCVPSYQLYYELVKKLEQKTGSDAFFSQVKTPSNADQNTYQTALFLHYVYLKTWIYYTTIVAELQEKSERLLNSAQISSGNSLDNNTILLGTLEYRLISIIKPAIWWINELLSSEDDLSKTLEILYSYMGTEMPSDFNKSIASVGKVLRIRIEQILELWKIVFLLAHTQYLNHGEPFFTALASMLEEARNLYETADSFFAYNNISLGVESSIALDLENERKIINELLSMLNSNTPSNEIHEATKKNKKQPAKKRKQKNLKTKEAKILVDSKQQKEIAQVLASIKASIARKFELPKKSNLSVIEEVTFMQKILNMIMETKPILSCQNLKAKCPKRLDLTQTNSKPQPVNPTLLTGVRLNVYNTLQTIFNKRERSQVRGHFKLSDAALLVKRLGGKVVTGTKNRHYVYFNDNKIGYFEVQHGYDKTAILKPGWLAHFAGLIAKAALRGFIATGWLELFPEGWERIDFGYDLAIIQASLNNLKLEN